ncbi:hypothetical protein [Cohnella luojiensis]|uniref:Uncharacterized protein n=1 Tax=Cohnella luojiensis TaxID=652876 RepID=A0A4Y8LYE2_9BACL|nr:hypothetical protein [Cohnella luojiensis]TFE26323.1 hypothetical protein E2980_11965 [Cohnella luojiensis]
MEATKISGIKLYPPQGEYFAFDDEEEYADKGRSWGLFGKTAKKQFWFKNSTSQHLVAIKGYQEYNNLNILVVEFEDGSLTCIHPSFLKEMQSGTFSRYAAGEETETVEAAADASAVVADVEEAEAKAPAKGKSKAASGEKPAPKKEKKEKLELPVDKVKFSAKIKEFATKPNPFSDNDDEVILLEDVVVHGDNPLTVGDAWCGYSNTLKALGLEVGNSLEFEGKVVDKKFNKEILYKVNNPSKITKS